MSKKDEITCIQLSKKTRDELANMGGKTDTFEDIIKGLMKFEKPTDETSIEKNTEKVENMGENSNGE